MNTLQDLRFALRSLRSHAGITSFAVGCLLNFAICQREHEFALRQTCGSSRVITQPRLLLADEPAGALHSAQARMIMGVLHELHREGASIVQATCSEALGDEAERVAPGRWLARAGHARIPAHSPQRGCCR